MTTSSTQSPMTPEIEIDALARELYTVKTETDGWRTALSCVKSEWVHLARHVLTERRRAEREAFRAGKTGHTNEGIFASSCHACLLAKVEAERRYPDLPSDAPRVPEAIQPLRPADTYEGLWLAVDDVTRKVNELVTALNALRSSPITKES